MPTDRDLIDHWVSIQSKEAQKNLTVQAAKDQPLPFTLHIDKNTPKEFTPRMPPSAGEKENFTAARVTCADTIVGCIQGYGRAEIDFLDTYVSDDNETFRGGYTISRLDYEHRVIPDKKLVPHAEESGEVWLVSYSPETVGYKPKQIGKLFIKEIVYSPKYNGTKRDMVSQAVGYLTHNNKEGIYWDVNTLCAPGYYKFMLSVTGNTATSYDPSKREISSCVPCTEQEFNSAKKVSAAMLSHQDVLPPSLRW